MSYYDIRVVEGDLHHIVLLNGGIGYVDLPHITPEDLVQGLADMAGDYTTRHTKDLCRALIPEVIDARDQGMVYYDTYPCRDYQSQQLISRRQMHVPVPSSVMPFQELKDLLRDLDGLGYVGNYPGYPLSHADRIYAVR